ncbi:hypothetical protein NQ315_016614 [Exocentrus adspersus]|uniref:Tyr recombinase domain-containing protein n=1 Tax=Exocentrus adspersus TaxID=1586481 RepID=A0AAV8VP53_9CUCU|nr:hypothetical protein NQ315_016614 [Exocentrus adspersus]
MYGYINIGQLIDKSCHVLEARVTGIDTDKLWYNSFNFWNWFWSKLWCNGFNFWPKLWCNSFNFWPKLWYNGSNFWPSFRLKEMGEGADLQIWPGLHNGGVETYCKINSLNSKYIQNKMFNININNNPFTLQFLQVCCESTNLKSTDVKDAGSYLLVSIPDTKTGISRKFTIIEEGFCIHMNQKCTFQPVGINTLAKVPSIVASFLNLPNEELYTGHCMRRTSTTLLANKGPDLTTIKRHGGWKSSAVAESYIEVSISNKLYIARKVQGESNITRSENDGNNPTRVVINGKEVACEKTKNEFIQIGIKLLVDKGWNE